MLREKPDAYKVSSCAGPLSIRCTEISKYKCIFMPLLRHMLRMLEKRAILPSSWRCYKEIVKAKLVGTFHASRSGRQKMPFILEWNFDKYTERVKNIFICLCSTHHLRRYDIGSRFRWNEARRVLLHAHRLGKDAGRPATLREADAILW